MWWRANFLMHLAHHNLLLPLLSNLFYKVPHVYICTESEPAVCFIIPELTCTAVNELHYCVCVCVCVCVCSCACACACACACVCACVRACVCVCVCVLNSLYVCTLAGHEGLKGRGRSHVTVGVSSSCCSLRNRAIRTCFSLSQGMIQ